MKVCIAEKPSVAKEIAQILGASSRKDGYFEGNGFQVTWTFGHLCTLKEPHDYTERWKSWNLYELPMIPSSFGIKVMENSGVQKQYRTIENLVNNCEEVINCGDAGIEGELIQRWVLAKAKCKKPIKRLWISSLTEEAIKDGFKNLKEGSEFDLLYAAGSSRAIGDWLLGLNATRLFTLKYGKGKQVLSIGRVQTPTLALIVNRQHEIDNFVSKDYWEVKTVYRDTLFSCSIGKIEKNEKAQYIIENIKDHDFEIVSFAQKEGKELPPQLYDLTSLQVECNKKYGYSADETLKYIQNLYEKKLVTYPRVDTRYLSDDIYPKIEGILNNLKFYDQLTAPLKGKAIRKSKKVFNSKKVTDHHAIIPTGVNPSGIGLEEKRVYDIITKRFIAVFYPDCIVSNTVVVGATNKLEFKATGKQILDPGWRVVYMKVNEKASDEDNILPNFEEGERGPHEPIIEKKQTSPPPYFTEASLLRAMETAGKNVDDDELRELMKDNGIGRPSTRANIIETLFRRKYIRKEKKRLTATTTGIDLIGTISNELLKSAELTGIWEKKLKDIERGDYQVVDFKKELIQMVAELCHEVKHEQFKIVRSVEEEKPKEKKKRKPKEKIVITDLDCPKCKSAKILQGKTAYGCNNYKNGCDFKIPFHIMEKKLTDKQIADLVLKGKTTKIKGFKQGENKVDGKLVFDASFNLGLE